MVIIFFIAYLAIFIGTNNMFLKAPTWKKLRETFSWSDLLLECFAGMLFHTLHFIMFILGVLILIVTYIPNRILKNRTETFKWLDKYLPLPH